MDTQALPGELDERSLTKRAQLLREAGLSQDPARHFRRPVERPFTRAERDQVTLLFGGLSIRQDRLIQAALEGLGYRAELVPVATKADFQTGKEYGNNGQCNPTYFTVGALVNYLKRLRDEEKIPTERILSDYVFVTAGACGPCRFGMYEAEYRLALRNAGFDGFRVMLVGQEGRFDESGQEAGLTMDLAFVLTLLNAIFMADLLNAIAFHVRPYETEPGKTNAVLEECLAVCRQALRAKDHRAVKTGLLTRLLARATSTEAEQAALCLAQLRDRHYIEALARCRQLIDENIEVDYTRAKPIVKITGEFWAQTTEGEGNFHMLQYLEGEGAEVLVEPVATWIDYTLNFWHHYAFDRRGLDEGATLPGFWRRLRLNAAYRKHEFVFRLAEKLYFREYERMRRALGRTAHPLTDQFELQRLGHPYYNSRSGGGEAYLEVAKNIYYHNRGLAHMVLSLKPFGCMPSTQSDGAQAAVIAHYPDINFLPIETSGEGDINAYSRTQMALGEAKVKCKDEFKAAVARTGYALEDIRAYVAAHRELRRPLQPVPHAEGVVGRGANFVLHAAARMDRDPAWARRKQAAPAGVQTTT